MNPSNPHSGPKPQAQLLIVLLEDGQVVVSGPVANKILSYGMIESARDAIANYKAPAAPLIQPVRGPLPNGHHG